MSQDEREPLEPPAVPLPVGLRVSLYTLVVLSIFAFGGSTVAVLLGRGESVAAGEPVDIGFLLLLEALLAPSLVAATLGFVHFLDRKPIADIGIRWPGGARRGAGPWSVLAILAAVAMLAVWGLAAVVALDVEQLSWSPELTAGPAWWPSPAGGVLRLLGYGLGFLIVAGVEELMLRGYVYSTLRERLYWVHAAGLTSLLFLLMQLGTETPAAALINVFLSGLGLAALRELTGSLLPTAIFYGAWNTLIACVLSLPVSGFSAPGLAEVTLTGPEAFSGGSYGPEGSWSMTAVLLIALVGLAHLLARRDEAAAGGGEAVPPPSP